MRNILEYPITDEEVLELLDRLIKENIEENQKTLRCGDMTALLLEYAKDKISECKRLEMECDSLATMLNYADTSNV